MKFKVCGLFDKENIFNVAQLNPDYIGHIFWEKSVRYVKGDTPQIDNSKKTGVFYNSNYDFISKKIKNHKLKCVQLHGDEAPGLCKSELPGGTGKTFNWELLKRYKLKKEFFISGGIGLDSINSLKALVQMNLPLYGIDVNSKFEDESNLKVIEDLIKFKEIIDNEI